MSTPRLVLLLCMISLLQACKLVAVKLTASPEKLACPSDDITLTWDGKDGSEGVTVSADPSARGLPVTGSASDSVVTRITADQNTTFTARQSGTLNGTAFVQTATLPLTVPIDFSIAAVCPPGGTPRWLLPAERVLLFASPSAIVRRVTNPSAQVRATHEGLGDVIGPGGSSNRFDGTPANTLWDFVVVGFEASRCPRDGNTAPPPLGSGEVDPNGLPVLAITIEAGCPAP